MDSILDSVEGVMLRKLSLGMVRVTKCMALNGSEVVNLQRRHCIERLSEHMTDLFSWVLRPRESGCYLIETGFLLFSHPLL